jgi:pheromone shutdown protein TraB
LKRVLIDERDAYLAEKIRRAPGDKLVAVVGAGHVAGLAEHLERGDAVDLAPLESVPGPSRFAGWFGWAFAVAIVGSIVALGILRGPAAAGDSVLAWVLATGVPCALGTALAFGHPLTIASGFFAAPITTLHPAIGAGYVTAFVQSYLRPPFVREFSSVLTDLESVSGLWRNRLLRVLMVFVLSSLGAAAGMWFGLGHLLHSLLGPA